jgi:hypothetical protein
VIRGYFDETASEGGAALLIATGVLTDLLWQLNAAERGAVVQHLSALDLAEIEPIVARQISRQPDAPGPAEELLAHLISGALLMARRMVEHGLLDRRELGYFHEALDDALADGAEHAAPSLSSRFGVPEKPTLWMSRSS